MKINRMLYVIGLLSLLAACAMTQLPRARAQIAAAEVAIDHAQNAGAAKSASRDLARARNKLDQAKSAVMQGETESARRLATEAETDATLALVQANTAKSSQAVEVLDQSIRALRQPIDERAKTPITQPLIP